MEKKERDWKMIIGMAILILIFVVTGSFFWRTVAEQAELVKQEEQRAEEEAIVAMYMEMGEHLKQPVFVDTDTKMIFTAGIPKEGIYNKKGTLVEGDVLEIGDVVKIYGDGKMTRSIPADYPGVTKMKRVRRGSLEEADQYAKLIEEGLPQ